MRPLLTDLKFAVRMLSKAPAFTAIAVLALGADRQSVVQLVLKGGLTLVAVGGTAGIVVLLDLGRLVERFLVGVGGLDLLALLAVPVVLGLVAITATYVPAWRASKVNPVQALRTE